MKQLLRLLGALLFLTAAFFMPLMTCVQKQTHYRETEAVVSKVEKQQSKGRRGRVSTYYHLHYTYSVDGAGYTGYDPQYQATGEARAGDKIRVLYDLDRPSDSRVSEGGGQPWWQTLVFLGIAAYLGFSFYRNRR